MRKNSVRKLTISALLIGMGVIIPMVMPKIMIPPASFTLASHVPLFIAMFFTPGVAVAVALGTTFGFFLTTPVIIAPEDLPAFEASPGPPASSLHVRLRPGHLHFQ